VIENKDGLVPGPYGHASWRLTRNNNSTHEVEKKEAGEEQLKVIIYNIKQMV
jgi:hypothetical protein